MTVVSADWVLPVDRPPIEGGAVAFEDGVIVAVGPAADLGTDEHYADAAIVPGFVNAHSHIEYAVYAGFGDGLPFDEWIVVHTSRKGRIAWDEFVAIARLGATECLRSGMTTIGDASFSGAAAVACAELGLRATIYLEVFGRGLEQLDTRYGENRGRIEPFLSERVRLGISPHAPYTVSPELYAACAELELPIATHLAESEAEQQWMRSGTGSWAAFANVLPPPPGMTGVRVLAEHGLLSARMIAAHCVKVDADEVELLARHDVAVAHCPRSNAYLGCGIAPLRELRAAGVRVGLGTDGVSSVPSHDMFDEVRAAVAAARAREETPAALSAAEALELATLGSAQALGREAEIGSLTPGKKADLAVLSLAGSAYVPWEDPAVAVVFGGSPERVLFTMVGGEPRYEKGGNEWHELTAAARSARDRLLSPIAAEARA